VLPEQGGLLTDIEIMINKLIDHDNIPGRTWYTSRRVESRHREEVKQPLDVAAQVASVRADDGWGIDESHLTGGKLGVAEGEAPPSEDAPPVKKPVFGKKGKRYSDRL
jgi:hypothetical protein